MQQATYQHYEYLVHTARSVGELAETLNGIAERGWRAVHVLFVNGEYVVTFERGPIP